MKLKKLISISVLSLLALTSIIGCSNQSTSSNDKESEVIRVGSDQTTVPFTYVDNGTHVGFEVDVWNEIGKRLNKEVKFEMGQFSSLFGMLDSDKIDTVANYVTVTPEREEKYDFAETYCYGTIGFLVNPDAENLVEIEDLAGKKIGVINGAETVTMLERLKKDKNIDFETVVYDDDDILYPALKAGNIDAYCTNLAVALTDIKDGRTDAKVMDSKISEVEVGYAFTEENSELKDEVSKVIEEMHSDGTLTELSNKWFGDDITKSIKSN